MRVVPKRIVLIVVVAVGCCGLYSLGIFNYPKGITVSHSPIKGPERVPYNLKLCPKDVLTAHKPKAQECSKPLIDLGKKQRIVIIGSGPTGLGAAHRLYELGVMNSNTQVIILEQEAIPGGLAKSLPDENGFLWDMGGHVVFSHYKYFDETLGKAVPESNKLTRAAFAFMKGSDGERRFIPYQIHGTAWVGKRVAVSSVEKIKEKIAEASSVQKVKDSEGGPNCYFRSHCHGATSDLWKAVAKKLPQGWFHFHHKVIGINIQEKKLKVEVSGNAYSLQYDTLITTTPLDSLLRMVRDSNSKALEMKTLAEGFLYSHIHIVGIGLKGQPPNILANKFSIYFPDSDSPFSRVTLCVDHDLKPGVFWSVLAEVDTDENWTKEHVLSASVNALVKYGFITEDQVVSRFYHRLDHGYPVPFLKRDELLGKIQPWLQSHGIYSRGRLGGWRYEVGSQDHSFMQGVEVSDLIMRGVPEETYPNPNLVNSIESSSRMLQCSPRLTSDYEIVISHYNENLDWLRPHADHCHVYHKGWEIFPRFNFRQWEKVPNVGRESHTYIYHIISNYDHLANVTVFLQGSLVGHTSCYSNVMNYVHEAKKKKVSTNGIAMQYKGWGRIIHVAQWRRALETGKLRTSNMTLAEFWQKIFGYPHPEYIDVQWSSCFGVSRKQILSHPKSFYEKIISYVNDHPNPEEGHYLERFWIALFTYK